MAADPASGLWTWKVQEQADVPWWGVNCLMSLKGVAEVSRRSLPRQNEEGREAAAGVGGGGSCGVGRRVQTLRCILET